MQAKKTNAGIKFEIHEPKAWGTPDVDRVAFVFFSTDHSLPVMPESRPFGYVGTKIYWIAEREFWVAFNYNHFPERSSGPYDVRIDGPFLVPDEPLPSQVELSEAEEHNTLVYRERFTADYPQSLLLM